MGSSRAVLLRTLAYVAGGTAVLLWAFQHGVQRWEDAHCSGPDEGDCDLGVFAGFGWAAGALVAVGVAIVIVELVLRRRRRRTVE